MLRTLFIASALALALFTGCSKQAAPAASLTPKVVDLGTVELTYDTPSRHDLGDGLTCVFKARQLTDTFCDLETSIEKSGKQVLATHGMTGIKQPVTLALGSVTIKTTLQPK